MELFNDYLPLALILLAVGVGVARELGWTKAVRVLTKAIEIGDSVDFRTTAKQSVALDSDPALVKKLKPFIIEAERELG